MKLPRHALLQSAWLLGQQNTCPDGGPAVRVSGVSGVRERSTVTGSTIVSTPRKGVGHEELPPIVAFRVNGLRRSYVRADRSGKSRFAQRDSGCASSQAGVTVAVE